MDKLKQKEQVEDSESGFKIECATEFLKRIRPKKRALTLHETIAAFKAKNQRLAQLQSTSIC